jgi:hypothetical protein
MIKASCSEQNQIIKFKLVINLKVKKRIHAGNLGSQVALEEGPPLDLALLLQLLRPRLLLLLLAHAQQHAQQPLLLQGDA